MRKKFQEVPGVPLIYGLRNALLLEPPSSFQHQFAKSAEAERLHMTDLELKMLNMKKTNRLAIKEARDLPDAHEGVGDKTSGTQTIKLSNDRKRTDMKDTVQFKRKKAKESKDAEQTMRNRSRKMKRSRSQPVNNTNMRTPAQILKAQVNKF